MEDIWKNVLLGDPSTLPDASQSLVIGLDFGSSNSCVSVWRADKNKVKIIRNTSLLASRITPSLIQFNQGFKDYKIGSDCDESLDNVISGLKALLMNQGKDDGGNTTDRNTWLDTATVKCYDRPATTTSTASGVERPVKEVPLEELIGFILSYLKDCAESYMAKKPIKEVNVIDGEAVETKQSYRATTSHPSGNTNSTSTAEADSSTTTAAEVQPVCAVEIHRVVLGIPANMSEQSKASLRSAAQLAGFTEVHFLVESTAAAAAYGLGVAGSKTVLVCDIGGGTTDLSLVDIDNGAFTVRSTGGSSALGGRDLDAALLELVLSKAACLSEKEGEMVRAVSRTQLLRLCRQCKEALSTEDNAVVSIPLIPPLSTAPAATTAEETTQQTDTALPAVSTVDIAVSRAEFEACIAPLTQLLRATVQHTIQEYLQLPSHSCSSTARHQATTAVAGRGSPELQLQEADGFVQVTATTTASTTTTSAADSNSDNISSTQELAHLPIQEVVLVGGSSRVPALRRAIRQAFGNLEIQAFSESGSRELCTSLHPEEVVAEGLAIRGAVLSGVSTGKLRDLLMMDCLASSIGVMSWEHETISGGDTTISYISENTSSEKENTKRMRVFDAVLHKGAPLPATHTMRFTLADPAQKFVSLDIYQEMEECRVIKHTVGDKEGAIKPAVGDRDIAIKPSELEYETVYSYHVIATADVPIPGAETTAPLVIEQKGEVQSGNSSAEAKVAQVEVSFTMTSEGVLKFEVTRVVVNSSNMDKTASTEGSALSKESAQSSTMLIVYAALMLVLYVFVKMALNTTGDSAEL